MISFSQNEVLNLQKIDNKSINKNVQLLLVPGETVIGVYRSQKAQVVFTDKRIVTVEARGMAGKEQDIFSLPYSRIQYFGVQTVGFAELVPDAELILYFNNGASASFSFKGASDILEIGRIISRYTLS